MSLALSSPAVPRPGMLFHDNSCPVASTDRALRWKWLKGTFQNNLCCPRDCQHTWAAPGPQQLPILCLSLRVTLIYSNENWCRAGKVPPQRQLDKAQGQGWAERLFHASAFPLSASAVKLGWSNQHIQKLPPRTQTAASIKNLWKQMVRTIAWKLCSLSPTLSFQLHSPNLQNWKVMSSISLKHIK